MKREAKLLLDKAVSGLMLSVDHFNKSGDAGRVQAVLILMDHSFEMLLKAALVECGRKIRDKDANQTIGFDACVNRALSGTKRNFLTEEQALSLKVLNGLRDATQHYLLDISERHLYITAQSGVTLFREVLRAVFHQELVDYLPQRVLPISTVPPADISVLFEEEIEAIKTLLLTGRRRKTDAIAKLRPLAIVEYALQGQTQQPSDEDLSHLSDEIGQGVPWHKLFPGVALIEITATGYGPAIEIHWTKKEGFPIYVLPEGTIESGAIAVKRVNELDFYNMNLTELSAKIGLTKYQCQALVWHSNLQGDLDCFKVIVIGSQSYKRYSQKAIKVLQDTLHGFALQTVLLDYRDHMRQKRNY